MSEHKKYDPDRGPVQPSFEEAVRAQRRANARAKARAAREGDSGHNQHRDHWREAVENQEAAERAEARRLRADTQPLTADQWLELTPAELERWAAIGRVVA